MPQSLTYTVRSSQIRKKIETINISAKVRGKKCISAKKGPIEQKKCQEIGLFLLNDAKARNGI